MEERHADQTGTNIEEPSVLLSISQTYREWKTEEELLETTCRAWVINKSDAEKKDKAKYALGVFRGKVMCVYSILSWHKDLYDPDRWAFEGKIAPPEVHDKYLGKSVQNYRELGDQTPVIFLNC